MIAKIKLFKYSIIIHEDEFFSDFLELANKVKIKLS